MNTKPTVYPRFFNAERIGGTLKEVSSDLLRVESRNIVGRWFHSPEDIDLFLWVDENKTIVKQQLTFLGQVVEWNIVEGTKTGVVIEHEERGAGQVQSHGFNVQDSGIKASETIRFDEAPQAQPIGLAMELIQHTVVLTEVEKKQIINNFFRGQKRTGGHESEFLQKYSKWTLAKSSFWPRFWFHLKRVLRKIFKPV